DSNPHLKSYLSGFGIERVTEKNMEEMKTERRLLFHIMMSIGASYFSLSKANGECWHFNFGNERGGKQFDSLPYGGNAAHSLLKNIRDTKTGQIMASWTNQAGNEMAETLLK